MAQTGREGCVAQTSQQGNEPSAKPGQSIWGTSSSSISLDEVENPVLQRCGVWVGGGKGHSLPSSSATSREPLSPVPQMSAVSDQTPPAATVTTPSELHALVSGVVPSAKQSPFCSVLVQQTLQQNPEAPTTQ